MSQLGMNSDDMGADVVLMNQELSRQQQDAEWEEWVAQCKAYQQEQSQAQTDAGLSPVPPSAETPGRSWTAGDVAKDIGIGVVEAPNAIIGGGIDAVNETMSALAQAGNWLRGHGVGPNGYLEFFGPDGIISWKEGNLPEDKNALPNLERPDTVTGGAIRDISRWVTDFALAGKLKPVQALGQAGKAGKVAASMTRGAIADFLGDDAAGNLSALVEQYPSLQNPVTEFLAAKPGDTGLDTRMKNALEGAGIGVGVDVIMHGLKALRGLGKARKSGMSETEIQKQARAWKEQERAAGEQYRTYTRTMGNPDGPLFYTEADKLKVAGEEVDAAMRPTTPGIGSGKAGGQTYIDGTRIYSGSIYADALHLGGNLTVYEQAYNNYTVGGYLGYTTSLLDGSAGIHMQCGSGEVAATVNGARIMYGSAYNQMYVASGTCGVASGGVYYYFSPSSFRPASSVTPNSRPSSRSAAGLTATRSGSTPPTRASSPRTACSASRSTCPDARMSA